MRSPKSTQRRRTTARIASAVVAAAAFALVAPGSAHAEPYDNTNPSTTGCATGAYTIGTRTISSPQATFGTMEVRYSPSCQTNWVRANLNSAWQNLVSVKHIERPAQAGLGQAGNVESDIAQSSFGMQLYAPGSTCITAWVDLVMDHNLQVVASTGQAQFC